MRKAIGALGALVLIGGLAACTAVTSTPPSTAPATAAVSTTAPAPAPSKPAPSKPAADVLESGGLTVVSKSFHNDGLGDWGGTLRVKNTGDHDLAGALVTVTVLQGDAVVATMSGGLAANSLAVGATGTVELIGGDPYKPSAGLTYGFEASTF